MKTTIPKYLKLSKEELLVVETLFKKVNCTVADLCREMKIPRMSLYTPINSLLKRGLIVSDKKSKFNILSLNIDIFNSFKQNDIKKDIYIHDGLDNIITTLVDLFNKEENRIYWIQTKFALKLIVSKIGLQKVNEINRIILKSRVINENILEEGYFSEYQKLVGLEEFKGMSSSLKGRPYDGYFIKSEFIDTKTDIIVSKDKVLYIDWENEKVIVYLDRSVVDFYKKYFDVVKGISVKVNFNDYIN